MQRYIANKNNKFNKLNKLNKLNKTIKLALNNYFYPTIGASIGVFPVLIFFM
jgi:hypothetical protein